MSGMTKLVVVRHGNTFNSGDVILRVGSATDIPLTETGMRQGEAVGRELKRRGLAVDRIFFAPLMRTRQSADGIAASFPQVPSEAAEFLTELDYGSDDGRPENEVVLRLGAIALRRQLSPATTIDDLQAAGKAALKKWDAEAVLPEGWEFLSGRVAKLSGDWCKFAAMVASEFAGKCVVAVTSNGIARFSKALLPEGAALSGSLKLATGAFGIYEYDGKVWRSADWNVRPEL